MLFYSPVSVWLITGRLVNQVQSARIRRVLARLGIYIYKYRISSIKRPGALTSFETKRRGAYSRGGGGGLITKYTKSIKNKKVIFEEKYKRVILSNNNQSLTTKTNIYSLFILSVAVTAR